MRRVLERLLNLLAFLRTAGRAVTADEIRFTIAGYDTDNDEAFRRMFERDKELLRSMAVPLTTVTIDANETGYLLPAEEYEMPDPGLTEEERAAIWLAARIVRFDGAHVGDEALYKLGGAGTAEGVVGVGADLGAEAISLGVLFQAVTERRRVTFTHRDRERELAPYGLLHQRGHWYVAGATDQGERAFRVDRGSGWRSGEPDAFERPSDFDLSGSVPVQPWQVGPGAEEAIVRFDADVEWWARRQLAGVPFEAVDGGVQVRLPVANPDALISWVLEFGAGAELISPLGLRAALVERAGGGRE